MMHKIILISMLITFAFGSIITDGEGSICGLRKGIFAKTRQMEKITISLEVNDCAMDVCELLQGPILNTLSGVQMAILTDNDGDTNPIEDLKLDSDCLSGGGDRRHLRTYTYSGTRHSKKDNSNRCRLDDPHATSKWPLGCCEAMAQRQWRSRKM
jgi:hypothetical protein